ncbi:GroES-like protein, partial [Thozetella sp. PMI_491]
GPRVQIVNSPVPEPNEDQVLIRVIVSGSNPKDWKLAEVWNITTNSGDDIAGIVDKVGANVFEFKPGDRVAAFHQINTPGGSFAEYAIAWQHTTFHIPKETTFEEAAALPLAAMTAAKALYGLLDLPYPWVVSRSHVVETPLIIYGASSSVGFYGLQFALRSNIHPILCVAGRAIEYVRTFIDPRKGDLVVDYREGDENVVETLTKALDGKPPVRHALDAVSEESSSRNIGLVFARAGDGKTAKATFVLGGEMNGLPEWVEKSTTLVGSVHKNDADFGYIFFRYISRGLRQGWFRGQRTQVVPGGLGGIQTALEGLKDGKASGMKYVFRIEETEGIGI